MRGLVTFIIGLCLSFSGAAAGASDRPTEVEGIEEVTPDSLWSDEAFPRIDRAVNLMTARTTRKHAFLFVVDHRNRQPIDDEPFHDFLGFDGGGIKVGLGVRFGILDNLDVGLYRLNGTSEVFDVYEFDLKFQILNQEKHFLDVALRPGVTWFSQSHGEDAAGFFGQALVSRKFCERYTLGSGLLFHSDSSNDTKTDRDDDHSLAVQALLDVRLISWISWNIEMAANVAGYGSGKPALATSVRFITHRHTFSVVLSNTQYMSADGVVANTDRGFGDLVIGFQITRELQL